MKRKQFLIYTGITMVGTMFAPNLVFRKMVEASSLQVPKIIETNLKFREPLENRIRTDMLIFHHIGGTNRDVSAAEVHQWHLSNGWAGIGYHYVIRKDGRIERGRPLSTVGAHCYGYNKYSVGINLAGDFNMGVPTKAQLDAAKKLAAFLCLKYRLNRRGKKTIFGHRDLNSTECPGNNLYCRLDDIRRFSLRGK